MAKKPTAAPAEAGPEMPSWFNADLHRVEPRGIVLAATGDLLAEDGLPVNAAARAAWAETDAAEAAAAVETLPAEAPAADQE